MYVSFPTGHSNAPLPGSDAATSDDFSHLTPNLHVNLEVLAADIAELENQIFHLNRSNKELREFLEKEPDEKEYQSAIFENVNVLEKKLVQLSKMKELQTKIMGTPSSNVQPNGGAHGTESNVGSGETKGEVASLPGLLL
tara:strand:- start:2 stop:421 length:420 start_codon:yes stop_codon:yes gene_type:complete